HNATMPHENGTQKTRSADAWTVQKMTIDRMLRINGQISRSARAMGIRAARSAGSRPPAAPISAANTRPPASSAGMMRNLNNSTPARAAVLLLAPRAADPDADRRGSEMRTTSTGEGEHMAVVGAARPAGDPR